MSAVPLVVFALAGLGNAAVGRIRTPGLGA